MRIPFLNKKAGSVTDVKSAGLSSFFALATSASARWSSRSFSSLAREGFMNNPVAYRAVRMISEAAASVPWVFYSGDTEAAGHPLKAIFARPNQRQSGAEFFEALYGHLLLSGNAFVEPVSIGATLRELHLLRPDRIRIVEGPDGWPSGFEYRVGSRVRRLSADGEPGLLHLRLFHPLDYHMGFAPLEAASKALDLSNACASWNKALLDNSARPSGALVYQPREGGNLSAAQYERLKAELADGYSGPARAGRPMLLEGGLDWKSMGLSPREMDFAEAKNGAARDVALAFGVPPMLIGIPGDNTYANYAEANRAFWRLTVVPLIARTAEAMTGWLAHVYDGLRLRHDLDQVPGLSAERNDLWTRIGHADFLTEAEKREAVGYAPQT